MKDDCLHCVLNEATRIWIKNNQRASHEAIIEMVGQFTADMLATHAEKQVTLAVLDRTFMSHRGTLH